jgi:hypothetical protein
LPSIINACVLTSAFSSGNTGVYISSRMLYGLALRGQAPKIFVKTTRGGLPFVALIFVICFMPLCYMTLASGAETVLNWLTHLTALWVINPMLFRGEGADAAGQFRNPRLVHHRLYLHPIQEGTRRSRNRQDQVHVSFTSPLTRHQLTLFPATGIDSSHSPQSGPSSGAAS